MKWLVIVMAFVVIAAGVHDHSIGESTLSSGRSGSRSSRTVTRVADGQEYYGFVAIKLFTGCCLIGLYRFMEQGEDTWY
ncbi:MAG: hypothetical protein ABF322_00195 [Lentimonas sp.]